MLRMLNRSYKQSVAEILEEFPYGHFLMKLDNALDFDGYLIAVSEEIETHKKLCSLRDTYPEGTYFCIGGVYKNVAAIGVQNILDEE